MYIAYVVTGILQDAHTVTLDEALPLTSAKVRLVIEPLSPESQRSYPKTIAAICKRQQARGHRPPTPEQVDTYLQAERERWGD